MLEDYESAIEDYSEAIRNATSNEKGVMYFNRANSKVKLENFSDALDDYDAASRESIRYSAFNKGNTLLLLGRLNEALECYRSEVMKWGEVEVITNNIGNMNVLIGRVADGLPTVSITAKDDAAQHRGAINIEICGNDKAKQEMPALYPHHKGEVTFVIFGNAGNVGNFGGGDTAGGEGLPGDKPIFVNFVW